MREETINALRDYYISERVAEIDKDFLDFEEEMSTEEDLGLILSKCYDLFAENGQGPIENEYWENPHNSILLYVTGLTNTFDFEKGRSDTIDGSPPDIDMDFDALDRWKILQWVVDKWGRENVAQIGTFGTFRPKGIADDYFRVLGRPAKDVKAIKDKIPEDKFGKPASLEDVVKNNPDFPERFPEYYNAASKLEDMIAREGIHAAGVVLSHFPVSDVVPIRMKKDKLDKYNAKKVEKWVTQFDMKETEELGLIKFDFLGIENLSIVKEVCRLIKKYQGLDIDPYKIADGDEKTYQMLEHGLVTGVFQMETSGSAKDLIARVKPRSISELSDINALNRPGPMQANFHNMYIDNKAQGYAPPELPPQVAEILKDTYWTLVYQEQVMRLCTELAGFTAQEADDVRRAMGKKKEEVLRKWRERFIDGCVEHGGMTRPYARSLWINLAGDPEDPKNNGFADYCLTGNTRVVVWDDENGGWTTNKISDIVKKEENTAVKTMWDKDQTYGRVTQWHKRGVKTCRKYKFEDGSEVVCTPDHQFMTTDHEWVTIEEAQEKGLDLIVV